MADPRSTYEQLADSAATLAGQAAGGTAVVLILRPVAEGTAGLTISEVADDATTTMMLRAALDAMATPRTTPEPGAGRNPAREADAYDHIREALGQPEEVDPQEVIDVVGKLIEVGHKARILVESAIRTAHDGRPKHARWVHVRDALCVGSTTAAALCDKTGLDPDEEVGETAEETLERLGVDPSEVTDGGLDALCLGCGTRDARCDEDGLCVSCGGTIVLVHPSSTEAVDELRADADAYHAIRDVLGLSERMGHKEVLLGVESLNRFAQTRSGEVPRG